MTAVDPTVVIEDLTVAIRAALAGCDAQELEAISAMLDSGIYRRVVENAIDDEIQSRLDA